MTPNRPSPRPGFTHIADHEARRRGPVVAAVSDSPGSLVALRRAAEEAAMLSVRLQVVDVCSSGRLKQRLLGEPENFDARDRAVALSILRNPNVAITQVDVSDFAEVVDMCQTAGASLLVMDAQCLGEPTVAAELIRSTADDAALGCDVLIVSERIQTAP
ncbi:MAG: universal stress protein [Actinomycetota bacterium]